MRRFQADFRLCATIYVKAKNEEEAKAKIEKLVGKDQWIEIGTDHDNEIDDEGSFISPAMTCYGPGTVFESGPFVGDTDYGDDEPGYLHEDGTIDDDLRPTPGRNRRAPAPRANRSI